MKNEWVMGVFAAVNVLGYLAIDYIIGQYPAEKQLEVMVPGMLSLVAFDIVALVTLMKRKREWYVENRGIVLTMVVFLSLICLVLAAMQYYILVNPPAAAVGA